MIHADHLTKRYGDKTAVHDLTFTVRPGIVTGFLGPNGAGKSTTMRMMLGLDSPSAGSVTVNGRRYADHPAPMREVGALLEARAVHTGRSAVNHLRVLGATTGIGRRRVDQVIHQVGLADVAGKRAGAFSLGMGQRLGLGSALLGDPHTLILDEPVNGLDPDGVLWIRTLLRDLAAEGRTVLLSSHLMAEMALTADHLIVVGRGRLLRDLPLTDLIAEADPDLVLVRSPDAARLRDLLTRAATAIHSDGDDALEVHGVSSAEIGAVAAAHGLTLHQLTAVRPSLEEAYMRLTGDSVEYRSSEPGTTTHLEHPTGRAPVAVPGSLTPTTLTRVA